jgi:arabinofuranosyltransferase
MRTIEQSRWAWVPQLVVWCLLGMVLVKTAWVCDDAYITFRTVDNILDGYGATWNPDERVQAYTHPLWMILHLPFQGVARNVYWVTICLSLVLSLMTVALLRRSLQSYWMGLAVVLVAVSSKAFMEFSTSGLENPLSHLLLVLFVGQWWRNGREGGRLLQLSLLFSLLLLCRMDFALLAGPALGMAFWRERSWRALRVVVIGMLPFVAWEVFSVIYYGFPFPNTAYAKLGAEVPQSSLWEMGWAYFGDSLHRDPVTLPLILVGIVSGFRLPKQWPLALGMMLYLVYVARIGGDFMSGRFFTGVMLVGLMLVAQWLQGRRVLPLVLGLGVVGVGLLGPTPMLLSGADYQVPPSELLSESGVSDERAYYYPGTGLLRGLKGEQVPFFPFMEEAEAFHRSHEKYSYWIMIGLYGYTAGPEKHVIDVLGLSDPLLARMPTMYHSKYKAGHYTRTVVDGYEASLAAGRNLIVDRNVHALYDMVLPIVRGPLFSSARWEAILQLNLGLGPDLDLERFKVPVAETVQLPVPAGRNFIFPRNEGAKLLLPRGEDVQWLRLTYLEGAIGFHVAWLHGGEPIAGFELDYFGEYQFEVPFGADAVALYPNDHVVESRVVNVAVN